YLYQLAQIDYKIKTGLLKKELALEMFILNLKSRY
ncbi:DNA polymerase III subunit delta, partial [Turicibacter sanguinis]|nr:DNA polymerase III subunit delta [Turicibacter sanguinis]